MRIGDETRSVRAAGHRDRSWGPRNWRVTFTLGDLQSEHAQLYFVGAPQLARTRRRVPARRVGRAGPVRCIGGSVDYDDAARTIAPAQLKFATADGDELDVELEPASPSISFDMAHTCEVPEHWLYWRILVDARVSGWSGTARRAGSRPTATAAPSAVRRGSVRPRGRDGSRHHRPLRRVTAPERGRSQVVIATLRRVLVDGDRRRVAYATVAVLVVAGVMLSSCSGAPD